MTQAMTESLVPTDAEIDALDDQFHWDTTEGRRAFARAVLAKWGTQPAGAQAAPAAVAGPSKILEKVDTLIASINEAHISKDAEWKRGCFAVADSVYEQIKDMLAAAPTTQPSPASQEDALDAARYRWLRHGDNDEKVLKAYTSRPSEPGEPTMFLPRTGELDRLIDAARAA